MKYTLSFLALWILLLPACQLTKSSHKSKDENFIAFYQRFHRDSLFQMERLAIPVDGYAIEGGSIQSWQREKWAMHKNGLTDMDTTIYTTQRVMEPQLIRERIFQANSSMLIERHFSLREKKWFLTFYLYVFL